MMMVVDRELVLDLTEDTELDYKEVLDQAIDTVLYKEIYEFTLVSHLNRIFSVKDLTQILKQTTNLEVLSLFSIALSGTLEDFSELGKALKRHQELKEVHMVDCGMLGNWVASTGSQTSSAATPFSTQKPVPIINLKAAPMSAPAPVPSKSKSIAAASEVGAATSKTAAGSVSATTLTSLSAFDVGAASEAGAESTKSKTAGSLSTATASAASEAGPAASGKPSSNRSAAKSRSGTKSKSGRIVPKSKTKGLKSKIAAAAAPSVSSTASRSKTTSAGPSHGSSSSGNYGPSLDVILHALASIPTLENVEIYGIPGERFDKSSDGDQESGHQVMQEEGEADMDIPMVPMGEKDSVGLSDGDYMADYDEDIRGIPGHGQVACSITKQLSMMMSPEALGLLCKGKHLTNLGLEDVGFKLKHVKLLAEAFSTEGHKIKELKLYGCNIDDKGALAIAHMLKENKTLEKLDLSYNHIGDEGCVAIAVALRGNETLKCLNLMGNECAETYDMKSEGGCYEALLELLEKNKTLKDLILEPFDQDDNSDCVPEFIIIPNKTSPEEEEDFSSASDDEDSP